MTLSFDELRVFVVVAEAGSLTAAASRLGLAKSTLSRRLTALEEQLGVRLLQRTTRRIELTRAGQLFFERCRQSFSRVEEAVAELSNAQTSLQASLTILAPTPPLTELASSVALELMSLAPDLKVQVIQVINDPPSRELATGSTWDFALEPQHSKSSLPLGAITWAIYLSPHLAEQLESGQRSRSELRLFLLQSYQLDPPASPQTTHLPDLASLLDACQRSLGLALLPTGYATHALQKSRILALPDQLEPWPVEARRHPQSKMAPATEEALKKALQRRLNGSPWTSSNP